MEREVTQAPTPGPLSVGNLHTEIMEALAEDIQRQRPDAFRLAPTAPVEDEPEVRCVNAHDRCYEGGPCPYCEPTAPVEASGSERWTEDMERERREADYERGFRDGQNSRPQPSGETREAVARVIDPAGWATWDHQSGEIDRMGLVGVERNGAIMSARSYVLQSLKKTDAILALLSARPLALGGQQGEGEAEQ